MHPSDLSRFFDSFANLLEIRGHEDDAFPILAYRRAAETLCDHEGDIGKLIAAGKLHELPGIGKRIEEKAIELMKTGKVQEYEDLKKKYPESLLEVLKVPSLGPKKTSVLFRKLKVKDLSSLKKALESGKAAKLPRFGEKTVTKLLEGVAFVERSSGRVLLGNIEPIVENLLFELKTCKSIRRLNVAGSYRRREETVGDIDILAVSDKPSEIAACVKNLSELKTVIAEGETKISFRLQSDLQVDILIVEEKHYGAALQYFTGSKAHNLALRTFAKDRGYKISEYGIFSIHGKKETFIGGALEEEIYSTLGMDYIPPELRQDTGEMRAALSHSLPALIEHKDIRGDLHVHSTWSDGRGSVDTMVSGAKDRGYEYVIITDHSPGLAIAQGPKTREDILRKRRELDEAQTKHSIRVLCGTEVDIRPDGSLDYPDAMLREFDFVIAAVHSGFYQDNTPRLLLAMEHPLVHAIAHPTGRLIGMRQAYIMNEERIFEKARETGTWLEVDGQPARLDLPYGLCRKAKEYDMKFILSSDAHSESALAYMDLAVSMARRGWLELEDIVNAMSVKDFEGMLK